MNVKLPLILCTLLTTLAACNKKETSNESSKNQQNTSLKTDPIPATINKKEVARIALIEAKQFISNAINKKLETSAANQAYKQAENLFDAGKFKQAQIKAVEVRQMVEDTLLNQQISK